MPHKFFALKIHIKYPLADKVILGTMLTVAVVQFLYKLLR